MKNKITSPFVFILFFPFYLFAQQSDKYSEKNWQLTDFQQDSVYGTSVNKVYEQLLKATVPGSTTKADFSTLSATGGIANAYNALRLAATLKGERKLKSIQARRKEVRAISN